MEWYEQPVKRLWLDIDGVLADFETHFLSYLKLPKYPPNDWDDPRFRDNFNKIADDAEFWLGIPPLTTPQALSYPVAGYCTARPIDVAVTQEWLDKNGFPRAKLISVGLHGSKEKVLFKHGCDVMIDDSFQNFCDINRYGIKCYLHTRPHNKKYKEVIDLRVPTVQELVRILKGEHEGGS